jgi:GxxExxY protein
MFEAKFVDSLIRWGQSGAAPMAEILHKELSFAVNGCIFDVHSKVGSGLREETYQKGLEIRLAEKGLPFVAKPHTRRELIHRGEIADIFEPDFVVADRMILELKAQREGLNRVNFMQTLNYVKCWGFALGILANLAEAKAVIERVPYDPRQVTATEDYEFIKPLLTPSVREDLLIVRESLLAIHRDDGWPRVARQRHHAAIDRFGNSRRSGSTARRDYCPGDTHHANSLETDRCQDRYHCQFWQRPVRNPRRATHEEIGGSPTNEGINESGFRSFVDAFIRWGQRYVVRSKRCLCPFSQPRGAKVFN